MKKAKDLLFNKILSKKRIWIPLAIVLSVGIFFLLNSNGNAKNTVTDTVKYTDLKQTVLSTGQVVSSTDLNLSFNMGGIVKSVKVKVGDVVRAGQVIATLDQSSELANLTSAKGALAAANARYKRTLEGATNEEIALSQITLDQTKLTQNILVENAYKNLLNSTPEAVPKDGTQDDVAPTISGTYGLGKEGKIYLNVYYSSGGLSFSASGLTVGTGQVNTVTPQPIGNSGLSITFPSNAYIGSMDWVVEIPNKQASDYLTNYNAYQAALSQAKSAIDQSTAELAIKKASARQSDIDLANADIITAQGQVEQAQARYNDTMIKAPLDGTITSVDVKQGELATAQKEAFILQDVSNIYLEANVNEANIANMSVGMPIDVTYDAFGSDKIFKGVITKIDPSSTFVSGVVNYKITASVEKVDNLRPGMTANMTIKVKEKNHVLVIPSRSILIDTEGKKTVRLITNTKNKKFKEVPITTGLEGDGGMVEVTSGLNEGDEFVVLIKTK
jgi:HlyD family secretion protein